MWPSPDADLYGGGLVYRSSKVMITITIYESISKYFLLLIYHGYDIIELKIYLECIFSRTT